MPDLLSYEELLSKCKRFCAYRERCRSEIEQKIRKIDGARHMESLISALEEDDYLNEMRFVESYINGKVFIKGWGRIKVINMLRKLKIPSDLINRGIEAVDEEEYLKLLSRAADKYCEYHRLSDKAEDKNKAYKFLINKGFESDLVSKIISSLSPSKN